MINTKTQEHMEKLIHPSNYLIANLDVLGIKNKILCEDENKKDLQLFFLHSFIKDAKNGSIATNKLVEMLDTICFSDNIVVAFNVEKCTSEEDFTQKCHCLILYTLCLQTLALANGFLLRGSIKFGELYIDKEINFICGKGLVETYIEESKEAKFPRVITKDKELLQIINDMELQNGHVLKEVFMKDSIDGVYYLDYLQMFGIANSLEESLEQSKLNYEVCLLKDRFINGEIRKKHDWHINYFNNFCNKVGLPKYKIEVKHATN